MIHTDFFRTREDNVNLYKTYSDLGVKIKQEQTGAEYDEAIDVENSGYTYIETDIPVEDIEISDAEALAIIMGGEYNESN